MTLSSIHATRKSGAESFHSATTICPTSLHEFWQWAYSDLLSNALRGVLAEYIVATALGSAEGTRVEWDAFDVLSPDGNKIEVKSAAYLQSWSQTEYSKVSFGIQPTRAWNPETNAYSGEKNRQADVYVFCLLADLDKLTVDPLDLAQWRFFVLASAILDEEVGDQKTISFSHLLALEPDEVPFTGIKDAVNRAASLRTKEKETHQAINKD